jgi:hypothetical protein
MVIYSILKLEQVKSNNSNKITEWKENGYEKIHSDLNLLLERQSGLAKQNNELIDLNKKQNQKLEIAIEELSILREERKEKAIRKETHANRKCLPKRQPMLPEIYRLLIQATKSPSYTSVRLRIAFCLLTVTGIRINKLLRKILLKLKI